MTLLIFFGGMIAFVPTGDPMLLESMLVNLLHHEQELAIYKDDLYKPDEDCSNDLCKIPDGSALCRCFLEGAQLDLFTRKSATLVHQEPPAKLESGNASSIDWLVLMSHVNPKGAEVYPAKLDKNVGSRFNFGWDEAITCRFEEAECDKKRRVFGVRFPTGLFSAEAQPAPELVMFKATTSNDYLSLKKDGKEYRLRLKCRGGVCPVVISNSMHSKEKIDLCTKCESEGGEHFLHYRKLAKDPVGSTPDRLCDSSSYVPLDLATYPDECDAGEALLEALLLIKAQVTANDRIICPPVVMER